MTGRTLSVQNRHMGIHQDRVIGIVLEGMHRLPTIWNNIDDQSVTLQQAADHIGIDLVILGNKNATARKHTVTITFGNLAATLRMQFRFPGFERQPKVKPRALSFGTVDGHKTTHQFRQAARDRKPKPRSAILTHRGIIGLTERGKYLFLSVPRDTDAGIDNREMVYFLVRNQMSNAFGYNFLVRDFQSHRSLTGEFDRV